MSNVITRTDRVLLVRPALAAALALVAGWATIARGDNLYSNASAQLEMPALNAVQQTANGTVAQETFAWSEVQSLGVFEANATAGVSAHAGSGIDFRVADDVVVPPGEGWYIDEFVTYAYQPAWLATSSPFASASLRVWSGAPGADGSSLVTGDALANRLSSAIATTTHRVFATTVGPVISQPDTSKRLFRVTLAGDFYLPPGTYWLDWQITPASPMGSAFVPPATIANVRTQAGWNARQWNGSVWAPIVDAGKPSEAGDTPLDMVFMLVGTSGPRCGDLDFNNDQIFPDLNDMINYIDVFGGGTCDTCDSIDFNRDNIFPDIQDLVDFITVFAGGTC
jgi:hypothetical protein